MKLLLLEFNLGLILYLSVIFFSGTEGLECHSCLSVTSDVPEDHLSPNMTYLHELTGAVTSCAPDTFNTDGLDTVPCTRACLTATYHLDLAYLFEVNATFRTCGDDFVESHLTSGTDEVTFGELNLTISNWVALGLVSQGIIQHGYWGSSIMAGFFTFCDSELCNHGNGPSTLTSYTSSSTSVEYTSRNNAASSVSPHSDLVTNHDVTEAMMTSRETDTFTSFEFTDIPFIPDNGARLLSVSDILLYINLLCNIWTLINSKYLLFGFL